MKLVAPSWFSENKTRLMLLCGLVLVGALSFEAGLLLEKTKQETPLVLTLPAVPPASANDTTEVALIDPKPASTLTNVEPTVARNGNTNSAVTNCAFVGSKNSNKYHLPSCSVAKRIKPENRVCFTSKEEAERRGYVPSCME